MKGFDCATQLTATTIKPFAEQGFKFVGRYLADAGSWKRLSPNEAKVISDAGLYIISFFERSSDRVKAGSTAGTEDGKLALKYALEVGQVKGSTIYAAVDYDAPTSDFNAIEAYMRAFTKEIVGYELGVYGKYEVVKAMYERGVATKLMQTYAWSRGQKFDPISIYQYKNDVVVNGIGIDYDESNGDSGGWMIGMVLNNSPEDEDEMKLSLSEWKMLGDSIDAWYKQGWISDYKWAEKAYRQELTLSELTWLNSIVFTRQNGIRV